MKHLAATLLAASLLLASAAAQASDLYVTETGQPYWVQTPSGVFDLVSPRAADIAVQLKDPREVRITLEKGAKFCGSYRITVGEQEILSARVSDPAMCSLTHD